MVRIFSKKNVKKKLKNVSFADLRNNIIYINALGFKSMFTIDLKEYDKSYNIAKNGRNLLYLTQINNTELWTRFYFRACLTYFVAEINIYSTCFIWTIVWLRNAWAAVQNK